MPAGRPPKLDQVLTHDDNGRPVTVAEHIVDRVRTVWLPWERIADGAGITTVTLHTWTKAGGLARAKEAAGGELTGNEKLYLQFLCDLEKAESEAMQLRFGLIQREAQGGYQITKTTTRVVKGEVVEVVTTTETARPVWQAAAWQLERRKPAEFGRRVAIEVEPATTDERVGKVAELFEAYLAGRDDAVTPEPAVNGNGATTTP